MNQVRYHKLLALRAAIDAELERLGNLERPRRHRAAIAPCGTPSGYSRHRRNDEDACEDCKTAHRQYEYERAKRKRNTA